MSYLSPSTLVQTVGCCILASTCMFICIWFPWAPPLLILPGVKVQCARKSRVESQPPRPQMMAPQKYLVDGIFTYEFQRLLKFLTFSRQKYLLVFCLLL